MMDHSSLLYVSITPPLLASTLRTLCFGTSVTHRSFLYFLHNFVTLWIRFNLSKASIRDDTRQNKIDVFTKKGSTISLAWSWLRYLFPLATKRSTLPRTFPSLATILGHVRKVSSPRCISAPRYKKRTHHRFWFIWIRVGCFFLILVISLNQKFSR